MNLITSFGVICLLLGLAVLLWPYLLNYIVAAVLVLLGIVAIYIGIASRRIV